MSKQRKAKAERQLARMIGRELDADGTNTRIANALSILEGPAAQTIFKSEFERADFRTEENVRKFLGRAKDLAGQVVNMDGLEVIACKLPTGIALRVVPTEPTLRAARDRALGVAREARA